MKKTALILLTFLAGCILAELPSDVPAGSMTDPSQRIVETEVTNTNPAVTLASVR